MPERVPNETDDVMEKASAEKPKRRKTKKSAAGAKGAKKAKAPKKTGRAPASPPQEPERSRAGEFLGVVLLALSLLAATALVSLQFGTGNLMGPFGRMLALSLYALLGLGGYLVVLAVGFIGLRTLIGHGQTIRWSVWAGYLGATLCGAVLFHCMFPDYVVYGFTAGGKGGEILGELLIALFSHAGTYLVTTVLMLLCLMVATEASLVQSVLGVGRHLGHLWAGLSRVSGRTWRALRRVFTWQAMDAAPTTQSDGSVALSAPTPLADGAPVAAQDDPDTRPSPAPVVVMEEPPPEPAAAPPRRTKAKEPTIVEPEYRKKGKGKLGTVLPVSADGFKLPELKMLEAPAAEGNTIDRDAIQSLARRLAKALNIFGIHGEVTEVHPGPVVTLYEFRPAPGTKLSKIEGLDRDLALTLKAISVRVARIRGKDTVGIEVPNKTRETVIIQELLQDSVFQKAKSLLTMGLGKDISGAPTVCNLAKAPHLLVAGSTGSGKSVGINVMLMSLLYRARPDQVRLILIDPKMIEFNIYEGIPHLLLPVVTDPKQANQALRWAVTEMERRYQLMGETGVRNIADYNDHVAEQLKLAADVVKDTPDPATDSAAKPKGNDEPPEKLPYIVIVIDEFADLMMVAAKEVENSVARIAQKARAAGIHLVLATQRPSRDVITGLIKANFPSRLTFQVSSKVDSRVILDKNGAESLLGMGDMLFMPSGKAPERLQGAFVSTAEVTRVVEFLKEQAQPAYNLDILTPEEEEGEGFDEDEKDEMYDKAVFLVTEQRRASTSWIQRKLRIGYNRAARILELMEHEGVVGAQQPGARNREVLAPPPRDL